MPLQTPRVAAVQDLSGFGRCSLTVVLPVLSAMGAQCCPLLTAYLSAHTAFPKSEHSVFLDLTPQLGETIRHWAELEVSFDAVYSGFLGSAAQIDYLEDFIRSFRHPGFRILVDPVMGDHGQIYRTYTSDLCRRMAELAAQADCITPNFTEAALLLEENYSDRPHDEHGVREWLKRLSLDGKRSVILTGVSFCEDVLGAGCFDRSDGSIHFSMARREAGQFSGTGDLFASVVLGSLLRDNSLPKAMDLAVDFVAKAIQYTISLGTPHSQGVHFEPLLKELF